MAGVVELGDIGGGEGRIIERRARRATRSRRQSDAGVGAAGVGAGPRRRPSGDGRARRADRSLGSGRSWRATRPRRSDTSPWWKSPEQGSTFPPAARRCRCRTRPLPAAFRVLFVLSPVLTRWYGVCTARASASPARGQHAHRPPYVSCTTVDRVYRSQTQPSLFRKRRTHSPRARLLDHDSASSQRPARFSLGHRPVFRRAAGCLWVADAGGRSARSGGG